MFESDRYSLMHHKREKIQHCLLPNFLIYSLSTCSERQDSLKSVQLNTNQKISAACCWLLTWCFDLFHLYLNAQLQPGTRYHKAN